MEIWVLYFWLVAFDIDAEEYGQYQNEMSCEAAAYAMVTMHPKKLKDRSWDCVLKRTT